MYRWSSFACRVLCALALCLLGFCPVPAFAESPDSGEPVSGGSAAAEEAEHTEAAADFFAPREASGTAWLPDATPMYAVHGARGPWQFMMHENAFVQYVRDSGPRGGDQTGSINWIMGMAQRKAGSGRFGLRGMISAEPWTIG